VIAEEDREHLDNVFRLNPVTIGKGFGAYKVELAVKSYAMGGRPAIVARTLSGPKGAQVIPGQPYGALTVNIEGSKLADDEITVKTWDDEGRFAEAVLRTLGDVFEDTGRRIPTGYVEAPVWRIKPLEAWRART
jgi:hypothetical protein